jgi:RNA polymerase sigma-70 factor (ECF subfamily)
MPRGSDPTDDGEPAADFGQLLKAAQSGDGAALEVLIGEYRDYLLLIANEGLDRGLQAKLGASDHVQETLLAAHRHLDQFRGQTPEEFRGWLRQILLNDMHQARRRFFGTGQRDVQREQSIDDSLAQPVPLVDAQLTPRSDAVAREEARLLEVALGQLPENYRQVIRLRDWDELTFPEVGARMGISEEAARKLWRRAIVKLEGLLGPSSGDSAQPDS